LQAGADAMTATDDRNGQEQREIEVLEQQEADAMRSGDVSTLQTLWADDLVVNSTSNLIAGKEILLEMIKHGRLKLRTYERRPVRIVSFGNLVVTTGNEISQLVGDTAEFKLFDSYMNVWAKPDGKWQLIARHVGLITKAKPEPLQ
jgi:ketosteroid isomerase-like protein